jgi:glycosyltransferase involved in cell wall biosynthesis
VIWFSLEVIFFWSIIIALLVIFFYRRKLLTAGPVKNHPILSVIIPATANEKNLARCLSAFLGQEYPKERFELIVVEKPGEERLSHSFREFFSKRINLTTTNADYAGWNEKCAAFQSGADVAKGDWLIFTDSEITVTPELFNRLAYYINEDSAKVFSIIPLQECRYLFEKVFLIPFYIIVAIHVNEKRKLINGQFYIFNKALYKAIGGHGAVKNSANEDLEFAAYFTRTNERVEMLYGEKEISSQLFDSYSLMEERITKTINRLTGTTFASAVTTFLFFFFTTSSISYLVFVILNYFPTALEYILAWVAILLPFSIAGGITFYFRIAWWYGLLIPLGWIYLPVFFLQSITRKKDK